MYKMRKWWRLGAFNKHVYKMKKWLEYKSPSHSSPLNWKLYLKCTISRCVPPLCAPGAEREKSNKLLLLLKSRRLVTDFGRKARKPAAYNAWNMSAVLVGVCMCLMLLTETTNSGWCECDKWSLFIVSRPLANTFLLKTGEMCVWQCIFHRAERYNLLDEDERRTRTANFQPTTIGVKSKK